MCFEDAGLLPPLAAARELAVLLDVFVEKFVFALFEIRGVFNPKARREARDAGARLPQMLEQARANLPGAADEDDVLAGAATLVDARLVAFNFDQVYSKAPPPAGDRHRSGPFQLDSVCRRPILGRGPDRVDPAVGICGGRAG